MWSKISVEFQPNRITGTSQNFEKKAKFLKFLKIFSLIFNFYDQEKKIGVFVEKEPKLSQQSSLLMF